MKKFIVNWLGANRIENYVWVALAIGSIVTAGGFWLGMPCSRYAFWLGVGFAAFLLAICRLRNCLAYVLLLTVCCSLAAWTFSYSGIDFKVYHAPIQRLLIDGWNPVFQCKMEDVAALTGDGCSVWRTLFFAHGSELVCAMVAKGLGIFLADAFLDYFVAFAVGAAAYRFARLEWQTNLYPACLFALVVAFPFAFFLTFGGMIDYILYALLALALFSILNFERTGCCADLFSALVGLAFAITVKANGAYLSFIGFCYLLMRQRKHINVWVGVVVAITFACVLSSTPYLTSWINYGSPYYPLHTFNPCIKVFDINDAFAQNADADRMGYLARIVYAWFSTKLAIWGCALWTGNQNFNPVFSVPGGVAGMKVVFKILMWFSVGALLLAKKNRITVVCLVVFVMANIAPLRYIGYARYFAIIWLVPVLAAYNLVYAQLPIVNFIMRIGKYIVFVGFSFLCLTILAKASGHFLRQAAIEGYRQKAWKIAVEKGLRVEPNDPELRYLGAERTRNICGSVRSVSSTTEKIVFSDTLFLPQLTPDDANRLENAFPVCNSMRDYGRFHWLEALKNWPVPLWER